jgi:UDP-N-acetylmuramate dehydrogenase
MIVAADDMSDLSRIRRAEPMYRHTSWRVGGPADYFVKPTSRTDLEAALVALPRGLPVHWLGLGSNVLVRDGGIRGAVVGTGALPKQIERLDDMRVRVSASVPCMLLARQCLAWKIGPAVFFAGIPGSVGGALAMNAGAFGGETWRNVESVVTLDRYGVERTHARADYAIGYRSVVGPSAAEWFLGATFRFDRDADTPTTAIRALLAKRGETQPMGAASCGSVFRNPPGDFAGRLIQEAGLKGERVGGAVISEKHANFIVNTGGATAADIEALIERVRNEVEIQFGVRLELEVRILGEHELPPPHGRWS